MRILSRAGGMRKPPGRGRGADRQIDGEVDVIFNPSSSCIAAPLIVVYISFAIEL